MNKYLCGIDVGTTGAKTMIFDLQGNIIGGAYREYTCTYPRPNWVEQDVVMVLGKTFETCREAIQKANISPKDIASISLSTQRTTSIFMNEKEEVLKTISWQDNRTVEEVEEIRRRIASKDYYKRTGLPLNTTWIVTKMLWMKKNEPKMWDQVHKVVQLQDYILRHLGADNYYVDYPDACLFGCFDQVNYKWDTDILELLELDKNMLPIPTPCATRVGKVSKKAAELTGFFEGTAISVGAGDQNSASIGAGIIEKGTVSVSIGTGGMAIACLDYPFRDPDEKVCVTCHAITGKYQFEGYQIGAASVFRWYRDEIAEKEKIAAEESGVSIYDILNEKISQVPVGSKGLIVLPYFASAASPRWNPDARGVIIGLTFAHDRACIARACMEGITLEQKDIMNNMLANGIEINSVRMVGGATKSGIWNQIQADMYQRTCKTLKVSDSAVLGAAIMAGVAVGIFKDIPEAVKVMVKEDEVYEPLKENSAVYDQVYNIYCGVYNGLNDNQVFHDIAELQKEY